MASAEPCGCASRSEANSFDIPNEFGYYCKRSWSFQTFDGLRNGYRRTGQAKGAGSWRRAPSPGNWARRVQRLRKAYNLSLSELSEQSGVAKSIISQIERNETNPTLATIWRLAHALDVSIERVLQRQRRFALHRETVPAATRRSSSPTTASAGSPSPAGSRRWNGCNVTIFIRRSRRRAGIRRPSARLGGMSLPVIQGELQVEVGGETEIVRAGKPCATARSPHCHPQRGRRSGAGGMMCILKAAAME